MYSTSRWTLVFVLVAWITALDIYFIATFWPVIVCVATTHKRIRIGPTTTRIVYLLFTFPKVPSAISLITVYSPSLVAENTTGFSLSLIAGIVRENTV